MLNTGLPLRAWLKMVVNPVETRRLSSNEKVPVPTVSKDGDEKINN